MQEKEEINGSCCNLFDMKRYAPGKQKDTPETQKRGERGQLIIG
jgi:hypothetical protein